MVVVEGAGSGGVAVSVESVVEVYTGGSTGLLIISISVVEFLAAK